MLIGTPAEIAARLCDYAAIGVTEICAIVYSPDAAGALRHEALAGRPSLNPTPAGARARFRGVAHEVVI
jgi:hypothetical protein